MTRNYQTSRYWIFVIAIAGTLSLVALTPARVQADLPPRPSPSPAGHPSDSKSNADSSKPIGGYIVLQIPAAPAGAWTVVQWQDQAGGWHDVEGWRGHVDNGAQKVWWVHPADFGKGSFRWAVYQQENGELLATSVPFELPRAGYETVRIELPSMP